MTHNHQQQQRPDDTDSFTPRVRSDKRSITLLLGKIFITNYVEDIYLNESQKSLFPNQEMAYQ